jgi:hypothetical protein
MLRKYDPNETVDLAQDFTPDGRPVPAPTPAMSEGTTRRLAALEYQFVRLDADLDDVRDQLRQAAREAPRCAAAAAEIQLIRRRLRRTLARLDADISDAVAELERLDEAPPF